MEFWSFPKYVSVAEKMARAKRTLKQLQKKQDVRPIILQGSAIARTWWGKAWNRNLERYADYSNRIGRGRNYVRHGAVLDLRINAGEINSLVQGSASRPYTVLITIKKITKLTWQQITTECAGRLDSLQELLSGNFPKSLDDIFMRRDAGLFPAPKEITFQCSCPDWASMCKHVAATLYGIGVRLDEDPALFFTLRGVGTSDLITRTVSSKAESLLEKASRRSSRIIDANDLSTVFGIDLSGSDGSAMAESQPGDEASLAGGVQKGERRKTVKRRVATDGSSVEGMKSKKLTAVKKNNVKSRTKKTLPSATKQRAPRRKEKG